MKEEKGKIMFIVCMIILAAMLIISAIGIALDIDFYAALFLVIGILTAFGGCVALINYKAPNNIKKFIVNSGNKVGISTMVVGGILSVIGFFSNAGYEVNSYTNYYGGTNYYIGNAISALVFIGIFVAFIGAVIFASSYLISPVNDDKK